MSKRDVIDARSFGLPFFTTKSIVSHDRSGMLLPKVRCRRSDFPAAGSNQAFRDRFAWIDQRVGDVICTCSACRRLLRRGRCWADRRSRGHCRVRRHVGEEERPFSRDEVDDLPPRAVNYTASLWRRATRMAQRRCSCRARRRDRALKLVERSGEASRRSNAVNIAREIEPPRHAVWKPDGVLALKLRVGAVPLAKRDQTSRRAIHMS